MILVTKLGLLVNRTSSRAGITSCRLFVNLRQTEVSCLVKYGLVDSFWVLVTVDFI